MSEHYPNIAGYKARETAIEAAEAIEPKAKTLRTKVLNLLRQRSLSADEAAVLLNEDRLSIRPRFSELATLNLITDSGRRTLNDSGKRAIVWCMAEKQRSLFE
jgi:hypothetical protein